MDRFQNMSDSEILQYCNNKNVICSDHFYKRIVSSRYPERISELNNGDWKELFLRIVSNSNIPTIPKDIFVKIAEDTDDDRSILNMLSVNKKYYSEEFFKQLFKKRFPLLSVLRKEEESWKEFYLSQIYYLDKLKREFDIPYIPVASFIPNKIYHQTKVFSGRLITLLNVYSEAGNLNKVKEISRELGSKLDNYEAAKFAIKGGQLPVLKYLIENQGIEIEGEEEYQTERLSELAVLASKYGYLTILKYLVELLGEDNVSEFYHTLMGEYGFTNWILKPEVENYIDYLKEKYDIQDEEED